MKFFLKSKTILGIIISILPALLPELGLTFSEEDGVFLNNNIDLIVQAVGAVVATYGRFVAKDDLSVGG